MRRLACVLMLLTLSPAALAYVPWMKRHGACHEAIDSVASEGKSFSDNKGKKAGALTPTNISSKAAGKSADVLIERIKQMQKPGTHLSADALTALQTCNDILSPADPSDLRVIDALGVVIAEDVSAWQKQVSGDSRSGSTPPAATR